MKFEYVDKKTPIHNLHPACKIIWVLSLILGCFIINDPIILSILFLSTIPFVIFGKVLKEWMSFIKIAIIISLILLIINIFASQHGSNVLFDFNFIPVFGSLKITFEAVLFGISMCLRLITTISAFAILNFTLNPDDLLQSILFLKIPYKTVLTVSITIRFIPCLMKDLDQMQESLKTRGYSFNNGGFLNKIKSRAILIPPLLSNSLERSIQSAESMESRGFGMKSKKTFYKNIRTTKTDYFFIMLSLLLASFFIVLFYYGYGYIDFYQDISNISLTTSYLAVLIILVLIIVSPALFSPVKKVVDLD